MDPETKTANPAPCDCDPSKKARVQIADWDDFQEFDVVVQMPGVEGGPFVVERAQSTPKPENGAVIRTAWGEYHRIAGEWVDTEDGGLLGGSPDIHPLVVVDPAVALEALKRTGISEGWRGTVLATLGIEAS